MSSPKIDTDLMAHNHCLLESGFVFTIAVVLKGMNGKTRSATQRSAHFFMCLVSHTHTKK